MDSLRVLGDSLDSSRSTAAPSKRRQKKLNADFKAAALHLTNLYRDSLTSSQSSHRGGYIQALRDMLELVILRARQAQIMSNRAGRAADPDVFTGPASFDVNVPAGYATAHVDAADELRWLAQYLRARIEAIKGDSSDDDDTEAESDLPGLMASGLGSSSSRSVSAPLLPTHTRRTERPMSEESDFSSTPRPEQFPVLSSHAASTATSRRQPQVSHQQSSRTQRPARSRSATGNSSNGEEGGSYRLASRNRQTVTSSPAPAPTSGFSFSMPSPASSRSAAFTPVHSPLAATNTPVSASQRRRRKLKGLPSRAPLAGTPAGQRHTALGSPVQTRNVSPSESPLSPVGEEAMFASTDDNDTDATAMEGDGREERGNGRRGAARVVEEARPRRRRKVDRMARTAANSSPASEQV